jgi:membrane-associated phospholipid phosphatase
MIHVAAFDAMNAIEQRFTEYLDVLPDVPVGASSQAAALNAAFTVSAALYGDADELALWKASLAEGLATLPDDARRPIGLKFGSDVGLMLLQTRANDGAKASVVYQADTTPGHWNRTYPDHLPPLLPQWPAVRPFVVSDVGDLRPVAPPNLGSQEYADAVDQVMRLGGLNSSERTAEQSEIALFWADGGGTATPPGHWNRIAADVSMTQHLDSLENARMYALLNLAMADAGIASWDSKYAYNLWRPIEAIRRAEEDGNASTLADASWLPLLKTPPFPSYTSGHSTFSGAAATVLTAIFGDSTAFGSSTDPQDAPSQRPIAEDLVIIRFFDSFWQAAEEAGMSRIYAGIHFSFDNAAGLSLGRQVGRDVLSRMQ